MILNLIEFLSKGMIVLLMARVFNWVGPVEILATSEQYGLNMRQS